MNHLAFSHARAIAEISAGISGIAHLLEEDMVRGADDNGAVFMNAHLKGCAVYAIKHLSDRAGWLAESIADEVEVQS